MDFELTEEQTAVRDLARKILQDLASNERLKQVEASEPVFDRELWSELGKANLLGVAIDAQHGGSDMGFATLCVLLEEIGRTVAPVPALASLAGGALAIQRFGTDALRERWLAAAAAGDAVLTAALHEPGNDDPARPTTEARSDGDGFTLSGEKIVVPAATIADLLLVPARTGDGRTGLFAVDPGAEGVHVQPVHATDRQPSAHLRLEGVRVAADAALGLEEAEALAWWSQRVVTAVCAQQLGVSDRALEMTAEYARERVQFDRPIGSFQAVHQRAADAYILLQALRLTVWDATWRLDAGLPAAREVAVAKYWTAEAGQQIGYACQHLHGGIGIDVDYPMHRYYLWAKQSELTLGPAPVQLEKLGAALAA